MPFDGSMIMPTRDLDDKAQDGSPGILSLMTQSAANGARLSALETSFSKMDKDLEVIRATNHDIKGNMQLFVIAEQACVKGLEGLASTLKEHTANIQTLLVAREQAKGVWWAIVRVCSITVAGFTFFGAFIAAVGWLLAHHAELVIK